MNRMLSLPTIAYFVVVKNRIFWDGVVCRLFLCDWQLILQQITCETFAY